MSEIIVSLMGVVTVLVFCGIALTMILLLVLCEGPGAVLIERVTRLFQRWKE